MSAPAPHPECLYLYNFIGPDAGVKLQTLHLGNVGAQAAMLPCGEQENEHPLILPGQLVPKLHLYPSQHPACPPGPAHTRWDPQVPPGRYTSLHTACR